MVSTAYITLAAEAHDVSSILRKARVHSARTRTIDTAEFTFRRATLVAIHTPTLNDDVFFSRTAGAKQLWAFHGYVKKIRYEEPYVILECDAKSVMMKRFYDTDSYTAKSYETIANALLGLIDVTYPSAFAIDDACLDAVPTEFITNKDSVYDVLCRVADATNTEFRYQYLAYLPVPDTWTTAVVFYPTTAGGSVVTLEAGKSSGNEIFGTPKWTTDDSEIVNYVTVLYQGGSVTVSDATSISAYGQRSMTLMRKDINNSTDADNLADAIIANYKDPRQICECKIKQYLYTQTSGGGTTYEVFPYYFKTRIDDDLNSVDVSNLDCEKITIQWPEPYDIATFGKRREYTKGFLESMESRIYNVEKSVDQDVLSTSDVSHASVTTSPGAGDYGVLITSADANWSGMKQTAASTQGSSMRFVTDAPSTYLMLDIDDVSSAETFTVYKDHENTGSATKIFELDGNGRLSLYGGGASDVLQLYAGGSQDHVYMEFFADSAAQTTRSGYFGYESAGTTNLSLTNEMATGDIRLHTTTTGDIELHPASGQIIANADVHAPGYQFLGENGASDTLRHSHDAEADTNLTAYTKLKTITFASGLSANYRVKFDLKGGDATHIGYGRIYKNGVALGTEQTDITGGYVTKSEDLTTTLSPGDTLELWAKIAPSGIVYVRNFRVYYDPNFTAPSANS